MKTNVWVVTKAMSKLLSVDISVSRSGPVCFSLHREYTINFGQHIRVAPGNWICLVDGNGTNIRIETKEKKCKYAIVRSSYIDSVKKFFDNLIKNPVNPNSQPPPPKPNKKKTIPKGVKQQVWNKVIGEHVGMAKCPICEHNTITQMNFHAAHIHAEANGGEINVSNLMPTCAQCNLSCGTMNLMDYKKMLDCNADDISMASVNSDSMSDQPSVRASPRRCPRNVSTSVKKT